MNEHPILFSGAMVRAILDGRKTMTRRVVKPFPFRGPSDGSRRRIYTDRPNDIADLPKVCPYGQPGEPPLWVRETWAHNDGWYEDNAGLAWKNCHRNGKATWVDYAATFAESKDDPRNFCWRPSIHMPRWASRITLEITGVRVERVQEISPADAIQEGIFEDGKYSVEKGLPYPVATFKTLWDSLNAKRGYGWDKNPWVWVISFRRIES